MKTNSILSGLILSLLLTACAGGSGSSVNPEPTPTPTPTPVGPQFAYVLNAGDDNITQFSLGSTGELTPLAIKTISTGAFPKAMTIDKIHQSIYVANWADNTISQFQIGGAGELTEIAPAIASGLFPQSLVLSLDSRFLYATNAIDGTISQYSIAGDGALTLFSTLPHIDAPVNMVFSPSGKFAYVINMNVSEGHEVIYVLSCSTDEVEVFAVGSQGQLTSQQVVTTGALPVALKITATHAYVVNLADSTVSTFKIQANGNLQILQQAVPAGMQPESIDFSKDGKFAYVVDFVTDNIYQYVVGLEGQLTPSVNIPFMSGSSPSQIILN